MSTFDFNSFRSFAKGVQSAHSDLSLFNFRKVEQKSKFTRSSTVERKRCDTTDMMESKAKRKA